MSSAIVSSFLGALQASLSVLLVISYGVLAAQFGLLDSASSRKISSVCVRLFLPALLITRVGSELHLSTGIRYLPILAWSLFYNLVSIGLGLAGVKWLRLPMWFTPAISFNNTTSLPLLLVQSLESTGVLEGLLGQGESPGKAIKRAQSYFLVNAIIGNCLTFAVGPRLIDAEHAPERKGKKEDGEGEEGEDEERAQGQDGEAQQNGGARDELTSLLPHRVKRWQDEAEDRAFWFGKERWDKMSPRTQSFLLFAYDFLNAPLIGAVIGVIVGLTPPLHKAFFADTYDGGVLNAWLTSSLQNIGQLFVTLQVVVVGVSLSSSLRKMKRGEDSGSIPWLPTTLVFLVRFVIWPLIAIGVIYAFATKTEVLADDPILWFAMMLMPAGPPAMKLVAMADVNGADESEKMSIAKLLTLSYAASPVLAFAVVGALQLSQKAKGE